MPIVPILATVLAVGGIVEGVSALESANKNKPSMPALPSLSSSSETASQAQNAQRVAALNSGGLTDQTGGTGIILGSDTKSASLVGT